MTVAAGTLEYEMGKAPVKGCGISWSEGELEKALSAEIPELVFDTAENADLQQVLAEASDTEFETAAIAQILDSDGVPEPWRVGESIAEAYLSDNRRCFFPWPDGRDERKAGSSLPGADLVGLYAPETGAERFAFGEVKTSSHGDHPPSVMYGPEGLKQQLEDLCFDEGIRDQLVKYLAHRALQSDWLPKFKTAFRRYMQSTTDISVFGVLVRDVEPHEADIRARVKSLKSGASSDTSVELIALYMPEGKIPTLGDAVQSAVAGGSP